MAALASGGGARVAPPSARRGGRAALAALSRSPNLPRSSRGRDLSYPTLTEFALNSARFGERASVAGVGPWSRRLHAAGPSGRSRGPAPRAEAIAGPRRGDASVPGAALVSEASVPATAAPAAEASIPATAAPAAEASVPVTAPADDSRGPAATPTVEDTHTPEFWKELVSPPGTESIGVRARSASDAGVLRRKGHLKEQDSFITLLQEMHRMHACEEVMRKAQEWIDEHRRDPVGSRLKRLVPSVGHFFTPLNLLDAFREYDEFFALSRREFVPPNFAELRHILNIAQLRAIAPSLRLITFDADGTLYADGCHIERDDAAILHIIDLLRAGVHVAIVTAAGYPGDAAKFEARVAGLLAAFESYRVPQAVTDRFHIMGGECNYLLDVERRENERGSPPGRSPDGAREAGAERRGPGLGGGETSGRQPGGASDAGSREPGARCRLRFVPDEAWKSVTLAALDEGEIVELLDSAEALLLENAARLRLPVRVTRKPRAVGITPSVATIYEVLEDLALSVRAGLAAQGHSVPYCAFNGGADVFVDVGNKSLGLEALANYLSAEPGTILHVGDRFTQSGNDVATRDVCSIVWVANPEETDFFVKLLLADLEAGPEAGSDGAG